MREIATKKKPVFVQANSNSGQGHVLHYITSFVSCLGCQHFIPDWLGKLKPNKLSTGCQNELKGAAVEKDTNPGRRFLFFSRLRRSCARLYKTAMLRRLRIMQFLSLIGLAIIAYEQSMLFTYGKCTRQIMLKFFFAEGRNGDRREFLDC